MDGPELSMGIAQRIKHAAHVFQTELDPKPLQPEEVVERILIRGRCGFYCVLSYPHRQ
jgi:hypothetical protein